MDLSETHMIAAAALTATGVLVGLFLAVYSAQRSVAQPLSQAPDDERALLAGVLRAPERFVTVAVLEVTDFADAAHARIWAAISAAFVAAGHLPGGEASTADQSDGAGAVLSQNELGVALTGALSRDDVEQARDLVIDHPSAGDDGEVLLAHGQAILDASKDRNALGGAGLVVEDPDGPLPLKRAVKAPSMLRFVGSAFACAVGMGSAPLLLAGTGVAWWLGVFALVSLVVMGVVVSLVDLDTFYIDFPTFIPGTIFAWAFTVAAAFAANDMGRLVAGVVIVVAVAVLFEGANLVYRVVRRTDGMGMGDTMLIFATAGVPAALTGSWELAFRGVIAGMIAGILIWVLGALRGRVNRETAFAFGPFLVIGWWLAWIFDVTVAGGQLSGVDLLGLGTL